jgi:hypothetical protein
MTSALYPVGTRVKCLATDLGVGTITGHILVDGPYRVRFDNFPGGYEDDDPADAHHRAHSELRLVQLARDPKRDDPK